MILPRNEPARDGRSPRLGPGGNGFADWSLYRVGDDPVAHAQGFYDVLVGDNGYPATPGWDYVTGFGTPRVEGLIRLIDGR